ncbi:MAG: hypothetical protein ABI972_21655 [Acidobacteriota bacterium]
MALPVLAQVRGGTVFRGSGELASWGDGVSVGGKRVAEGFFSRGGCVADWNGDGRADLILNEIARGEADGALGKMVALIAPDWRYELIDTGASFRDCLGMELYGRRGVLVTHRQMQLRFYERVPAAKASYSEIYSIYTSSAQSGLAQADVDGDGRADLLHGNYWLKAPEKFELGWRLFALHTWFDTPRSAMVRIVTAHVKGKLVVVEAESEASPARFAWFEAPADPKQLWERHDIVIEGGLHKPQVLVRAGDGAVVVGEDNGPGSRLLKVTLTTGAVEKLSESNGYLAAGPGGAAVVVRR